MEEGRDCSSPHPEDRYDVSYFLSPGDKLPGKMYNLRGCYLNQDPYKFDRNFFKMSPGKKSKVLNQSQSPVRLQPFEQYVKLFIHENNMLTKETPHQLKKKFIT